MSARRRSAGQRVRSLGLTIGVALVAGACAHLAPPPPPPAPTARPPRSLLVTATAYNSTPTQTDARPHEAAWGDRLVPGMRAIAVSRDLEALGLAYGTRVRVEGLPGEYRVLDRTGTDASRHIDVYMGTDVRAARAFGRRRLRIEWEPPTEQTADRAR